MIGESAFSYSSRISGVNGWFVGLSQEYTGRKEKISQEQQTNNFRNPNILTATLRNPIMNENPLEFQLEPSVTLLNTSLAGLRSLVKVRRAIDMATDATTIVCRRQKTAFNHSSTMLTISWCEPLHEFV
jgi:hypothetical protein